MDSFHNISVFRIFPTSKWFFLNYSSLTYVILSFFFHSYLCEYLIKPDEATKSRKSTITMSKLLFAKIFSLKQKANQTLSATLEKIKYCLLKKTVYGSFKKQKPSRQMQIYSYIFWHMQTYLSISRHIHRHIIPV